MRRRPGPLTALLLVCLVAATLAAMASASAGASTTTQVVASSSLGSVIYPPQSLPLRFDHERHTKGLGLSCVYCHSSAVTSRRASDRLLPPPTRCDACHGTSHDDVEAVHAGPGGAAQCSYCHEGHTAAQGNHVAPVVIPRANLRFDHAVHTTRGITCAECHAGVARGKLATRDALPDMRSCLRCHDRDAPKGRSAPRACDVCHLTVDGSRLLTHFASGDLLPPRWLHGAEHGPDWIERHKVVAAAGSAFCSSCHAEKECVDCHDGRVRPRRIHPNDWLSLHPMTARQNGPSCTSCHREQSFCVSCHQRVGITMSGPSANAADRGRFHPPRAVWTDPPRTARHHSWEAERNLSACVSCHTERDCALCHATAARGGRGGLDPHPPGFAGDCRPAFARNPRPCLYCHDPLDRSLGQCR